MIDTLMNIGSWLIAVASVPNILKAIKYKDSLQAYSLSGAVLYAVACSSFFFAFVLMNNPISTIGQLPPLLFWFIVVIYKVRKK